MKRLLAAALLICIFLSGCVSETGGFLDQLNSERHEDKQLTIEDSTSRLDIYPDSARVIGKFDRPQFGNLNELQQSIYIKLDNAIYDMKTGFIDVGVCSYRDLELAYFAVRHDRPEYFWMPRTYSLRVKGEKRQIQFAENTDGWTCTAEERSSIESTVRSQLEAFYGTVTDDMTEFDRELRSHDWLLDKITYDHTAIDNMEEYPEAWTIEGVFTKNAAVCEGYSKAMQVLMYMLGLQCGVVTGVTDGPHMWNIVLIDGAWYHLDATSNDSDEYGGFYSNFNVNDEQLLKSHTVYDDFDSVTDSQVEKGNYNNKLPSCSSMRSNYFVKTGAYVTEKEQFEATVISLVCAAVREGRSSVEIGFSADIGFDYERDNPDEFFKLGEAIAEANKELEPEQRIKRYAWSHFEGGYSVKISW